MLTHANITSNCEMVDAKLPNRRFIERTTNNFQDVIPAVLPFFHAYGLVCLIIGKLTLGCKLVTMPKFQMDKFFDIMIKHKATSLGVVPHILILWANSHKFSKMRFEHLRTIKSGAAPLRALDINKFMDKYPHIDLYQGYGLTETSSAASLTPNDCSNYGTIGHIVSNTEAKIVKADGDNFIGLDIDEEGELLIRGPNVMKGYFNNKTATDMAILKDGWLRTDDLATCDKNGLFYIKDRLKELIKVKGFQVPPTELEELLRSHLEVLDAAVIGVPHPIKGEVPKAFVVKKHGSNVSENELKDFIYQRLVSYKRLEGGVQFLNVIPKTDSGKIFRRFLKEL